MNGLLILSQNLHANGALSSNHVWIIKGMDKGESFLGL
jgi:hypothetical protein